MKEIEQTALFLQDILFGDESFSSILKKEGKKKEFLEIKPFVISYLGCELRHHFLFESFLIPHYDVLTQEDVCLILLSIVNNRYLKKISIDQLNAYVKDKLGEQKYALVDKYIEDLDTNLIDMIDGNLNKDSFEYQSLRFNAPVWLMKMWKKNFGTAISYKIVKANMKSETITVCVDGDAKKLLNAYPDLFKETCVEGVLTFDGKLGTKRNDFFKENNVFVENIAMKDTLDRVTVDKKINDVLIYADEDVSPFYDLYTRFNGSASYHVAVNNVNQKAEVGRFVSLSKNKNIFVFENGDPLAMEASVSNKQDLVVCYPKSSSLSKVRITPDYIIKFNPDDFDDLIEKEKNVLEGCSKFVRENGDLVYMTNTITKKENGAIIKNFLNLHKEFTLVKERQYMPFEEENATFYVAHLVKKPQEESASLEDFIEKNE